MTRARLYVGFIFGFWGNETPHWEATNTLLSKTLGGCFPAFAGVCRKSPESAPERQTAKPYSRTFTHIRRCSCALGYTVGGAPATVPGGHKSVIGVGRLGFTKP